LGKIERVTYIRRKASQKTKSEGYRVHTVRVITGIEKSTDEAIGLSYRAAYQKDV